MLPRLRELFLEKPRQVLLYLDVVLKAYVMNLDRGIEILKSCYSKDFGRPADFDPVDMLRSLVLMVSLGITSVPKWVNILKHNDVLPPSEIDIAVAIVAPVNIRVTVSAGAVTPVDYDSRTLLCHKGCCETQRGSRHR